MVLSDNMRGVLLMNVAMAMFTVNDTAMKVVMQDLPLFQSIALRGVLATIGLLAIAGWMGALRVRVPRRDLGLIGLRTLAEIFATLTFLAALIHMHIANLSAIMQALPLAVTLAAALLFAEPVGWRRALAIVVGFIGVLIVIQPGTDRFDLWSLLGLASVACVVVRDLTTRRISRGVPSVAVAVTASVAVTGMGWVGLAVEGWQPLTLQQAALLLLASGALILGYLTSVATMRVGDIGTVAPFRYMALLWAILLGWLVFGNLPGNAQLLGAALIVASGIYTVLREARLRRAALRR